MQGSNIISAIHHLKLSKEFMQDFSREHPGSKGAKLFEGYTKKIDWILQDVLTTPGLSGVKDAIRVEINSDAFSFPVITEKIALLNPGQRGAIEEVIENLLSGKMEIKNVD